MERPGRERVALPGRPPRAKAEAIDPMDPVSPCILFISACSRVPSHWSKYGYAALAPDLHMQIWPQDVAGLGFSYRS